MFLQEFRKNSVFSNPSGGNRPWRIRIRRREHQGYPPMYRKFKKLREIARKETRPAGFERKSRAESISIAPGGSYDEKNFKEFQQVATRWNSNR